MIASLTFFLLINIISLNIIFGIIIDTFGELRDKVSAFGNIKLLIKYY